MAEEGVEALAALGANCSAALEAVATPLASPSPPPPSSSSSSSAAAVRGPFAVCADCVYGTTPVAASGGESARDALARAGCTPADAYNFCADYADAASAGEGDDAGDAGSGGFFSSSSGGSGGGARCAGPSLGARLRKAAPAIAAGLIGLYLACCVCACGAVALQYASAVVMKPFAVEDASASSSAPSGGGGGGGNDDDDDDDDDDDGGGGLELRFRAQRSGVSGFRLQGAAVRVAESVVETVQMGIARRHGQGAYAPVGQEAGSEGGDGDDDDDDVGSGGKGSFGGVGGGGDGGGGDSGVSGEAWEEEEWDEEEGFGDDAAPALANRP